MLCASLAFVILDVSLSSLMSLVVYLILHIVMIRRMDFVQLAVRYSAQTTSPQGEVVRQPNSKTCKSRITSANCAVVALQAEAALAACSEALWTAIKQPARQRPTADEWFAGPFSDRLKAIQELALQRANPADTALAIETLQVSSGSLISCCMLAACLIRLLDTLAVIEAVSCSVDPPGDCRVSMSHCMLALAGKRTGCLQDLCPRQRFSGCP